MIGSRMCPVNAMLGQLWVNPQPTASVQLPTGSRRTQPLDTNSSHPVIAGSFGGGAVL